MSEHERKAERDQQRYQDAVVVAKLMCEELGLDPDELVTGENGFAMQQWETHLDHALLALAGWRAVHKFALMQ